MSKTPIEVFCIGFSNYDWVNKAISFLNTYQETFEYILLKDEKFERYHEQHTSYSVLEIYHSIDMILLECHGFHHYCIGVVNKVLNGKELGNLFGSMEENENGRLSGKAITSMHGVSSILGKIPVEVYF